MLLWHEQDVPRLELLHASHCVGSVVRKKRNRERDTKRVSCKASAAINDNNKDNNPAGTNEPVLRKKVACADDNENR